MDHSNHAGGTGATSTGNGLPNLFYVQKMYWVVLGAAVAVATLINVLNKVLALQRYHLRVVFHCRCWLTHLKIPVETVEAKVHLLVVLRHNYSCRA